jgi:hypothetical protein
VAYEGEPRRKAFFIKPTMYVYILSNKYLDTELNNVVFKCVYFSSNFESDRKRGPFDQYPDFVYVSYILIISKPFLNLN